jgi:hypothetical protein
MLSTQICDLPMSKHDYGRGNEHNRGGLTSASTPLICLDGRIGNRRFEFSIEVGDQAIQRTALFLTRATHQLNDNLRENKQSNIPCNRRV